MLWEARRAWRRTRARVYFLWSAGVLIAVHAGLVVFSVLSGPWSYLNACSTSEVTKQVLSPSLETLRESSITCTPYELSLPVWVVNGSLILFLLLPEILTLLPIRFEALGVKADTGPAAAEDQDHELREYNTSQLTALVPRLQAEPEGSRFVEENIVPLVESETPDPAEPAGTESDTEENAEPDDRP
ncbi:hypothetical protein [Plantibacter flavus]|uniref:hypothetical protein n=1 Tax=Plantibacter flavus TaxID=150123 RepID=UPI0010C20249|nr:hypothetical protein [Plantibacter flavus]